MEYQLGNQVLDLLHRASEHDQEAIADNIASVLKEPGDGRASDRKPGMLRHVCRNSGWILEYRHRTAEEEVYFDGVYPYFRG